MVKPNYQEALKLLTTAVTSIEDAISWLNEEHEDRESLHDIIDDIEKFRTKFKFEIQESE